MRITTSLRVSRRIPLLQTLKTSVAVVLAWVISLWLLPGELPIFAAMAAIFVVQPSINQSLGRALERSLGVVGGVLVALGIGLWFGQDSWIVLAAIVLCILLAWALKLSPGSANQIPISAMLVLVLGAATPTYARDRIIETILGAAIAVIVNALIVPPVLLTPAHDAVTRLTLEVAATFDRVATALLSPQKYADLESLMIQARLLRPMLAKAERAISQAEESLTLNPRQSRHREVLDADTDLYARLVPLVTRALGMTRALRDHYDDSLHLEPTVQAFAIELERAAHDLRLLTVPADGTPADSAVPGTEPLALTAPLMIMTPHPQHWILIGALMEDLRRVREEITGE
ncbi:hypothetical protein C3B59_14630 [Cryobacterium zongtaii]|uniref:Integral membrane bound transporter domain-containing protein n=1 Tax=Cryobacterium zongtaii TaxID=1259217 RepID=A0A2S3Z935_9MICO|nr:FUSC family protein [Cryobacterium zongtaii]POH62057.1 hypothetical protein C3B59_14630 [Cryobacterium zongtaii]